MEIRKTKLEELDKVMVIYRHAQQFMADHGNPNQWKFQHPTREMIEGDILAGKSYVCVEGEEIAAVFYYAQEDDVTYHVIEGGQWLNDEPYGVVHRIASSGKVKGAGSFCMNWAASLNDNVRIDTHVDNLPMQNMLKKCGFEYCGVIYLLNGESRIAFHKATRREA
ncbi:MAG: GNAT family N-acetyltransferase [Agathobacter sp.]|nr:GNAT family N-acetyltransferase [Agathobacter sp.]